MSLQRQQTSVEQYTFLIEYMERNGDLLKILNSLQGRLEAKQRWEDLAIDLNACGSGCIKSAEKWKKVWIDWRNKTKKKKLNLMNALKGTGGGPNKNIILTELENRVLALMGVTSVEGDSLVIERGLARQNTPEQHATAESPTQDYIELEVLEDLNTPEYSSSILELPPPSASTPPSESTPTLAPPSLPFTENINENPGSCLSEVPPTLVHDPPRRRQYRRPTQFQIATSEFAKIETARLALEEKRLEQQHIRDMARIQADAARIELDRKMIEVLEKGIVVLDGIMKKL